MINQSDGIDASKTQRWLHNEDGKTFIERLLRRKLEEYSGLRSSRELIEIGRYQGKLEIIDWILRLREEQ